MNGKGKKKYTFLINHNLYTLLSEKVKSDILIFEKMIIFLLFYFIFLQLVIKKFMKPFLISSNS